MTRDQAIHKAILDRLKRGKEFVVVAECFKEHRPSYHVIPDDEWAKRRLLRATSDGWTNWVEVWPVQEA